MNKRKLHHIYTRFRAVSLWPFVALFVFSGLVAIISLRSNNQQMIVLREAVFQTDKDNGDVEKSLQALRKYVYAHMNTNLASGTNPVKPPIQLKYTYERLQASEKQRVSDLTTQVYVDAGVNCDNQGITTGPARVGCVQAYIDTHPVTNQAIPEALYKFDFISPVWSPDLAGWSLVICAILGVLCALRLLSGLAIHHSLRRHH